MHRVGHVKWLVPLSVPLLGALAGCQRRSAVPAPIHGSDAACQASGGLLEQTSYFAQFGQEEAVYRNRLRANSVREQLGLPPGRAFRRVGGDSTAPDVIWQLCYPDSAALQRDLAARARSPEFTAVRAQMDRLTRGFSRGFYRPADSRAP